MREALLLVDLQQDFLDRPGLLPTIGELEGPVTQLLEHARTTGMPVGHVRTRVDPSGADRMPHWRLNDTWACVEGTDGELSPAPFDSQADEPVFYKQFFSGFSNPALNAWLRDRGVEEVWIAGIYTHGCVRATALDAYQCGYRVVVVADAVASTDPLHAKITAAYLDGRAARLLDTGTLLGAAPITDVHYRPHRPEQVAARVRRSSVNDIDAAVAAAAGAAGDWSRRPLETRRAVIRHFRGLLEQATPVLVREMGEDLGKPGADAENELFRALGHLDAALELDDTEPLDESTVISYRPHGVVGLVTPWNNPVAIPIGKLAAAMLMGNAVVWKPAYQADAVSRRLLQLLQDSGLPAGLVSMVNGGPREVAVLAAHPSIAAISLTGPEQAGRAVAAICAPAGKPLQAELGGNNALLVLAGADIAGQAATWARQAFGYGGQRCTALRRFVVLRALERQFADSFTAATRALARSAAAGDSGEVGPLVSAAQLARVETAVHGARGRGARVLVGGGPVAGVEGHHYQPTVLTDLAPDDPLVQEELFGPVAILQVAEDFEHGLALVNGVRQGLLAGIAGGTDAEREQFARRAQAGILLDGGEMRIHPGAPFGGFKASQIGPPEHGPWDRLFFTRVQVCYRSGDRSRRC